MNTDEIIYLLASHLIIADGEININELQCLDNLLPLSSEIKEEQNRIFSDSPEALSLNDLAYKLKRNNDNIEKVFDVLTTTSFSDGFIDKSEKNLLHNLAKTLSYPLDKIEEKIKVQASKQHVSFDDKEFTWADSLKDTFFALIAELNGTTNDENEHELLSGVRFIKKVKSIAKRSQEDLLLAERLMDDYNKTLKEYFEKLEVVGKAIKEAKRTDENSAKLLEVSEQINTELKETVQNDLSANADVLEKKKRNINYFTIAFMGRTKTGKSTLHKVVTREGADDIGNGKLRTTRFNRSWYWENIRIVDTPGIGAPGGKSDTEIAKSIIDASDLVCYIVVNDAIQETEFDFIDLLKDKNKPLFIILNVKENLLQSSRLRRFFVNPLKWKYNEGNQSIQGHFDRIREMIGEKYNAECIEIIPMQLLAAKLFYESSSFTDEDKEALLMGSNIKEYIAAIKQSIFKAGHLRKSQNIIDGCNYQVKKIREAFEAKGRTISELHSKVNNGLIDINKFIQSEREKIKKRAEENIKATYDTLQNNTGLFAEKYYEKDRKKIEEEWKDYYLNKIAYEKLEKELDLLFSDFNKSYNDKLKETLEDISFLVENVIGGSAKNSSFNGEKVVDYKFGATIVTSFLGVVGTVFIGAKAAAIASFIGFTGPPGWIIAGAGLLIGLLSWGIVSLFTSKADKIKKEQTKLKNSLLKSLEEERRVTLTNVHKGIDETFDKLQLSINKMFRQIIFGSEDLRRIIDGVIEECQAKEYDFNQILGIRVLQQIKKLDRVNLSEISGNHLLKQIVTTRNYEKQELHIQCPFDIKPEVVKEISLLLQTNIKFSKHG